MLVLPSLSAAMEAALTAASDECYSALRQQEPDPKRREFAWECRSFLVQSTCKPGLEDIKIVAKVETYIVSSKVVYTVIYYSDDRVELQT